MKEARHMVILKGIILLACTGMVAGMYSNYVTCVVAKTKRRVLVNHTRASMACDCLFGTEIAFLCLSTCLF